MPTYVIQTTINPGVSYEVDQAEYEQLRDLGLLLNNNPTPLVGVFDTEVSALVQNVNSQTYLRLTQLPLQPHTHLTTDIADSGSTGRALLKTTSALDARTAIGALAATAAGAANGLAQLDGTSKVPIAQLPAGTASGVATLDAGGKIPQAQLPAVALQEFLGAVATQAAMLALDGQRGDWVTRTDRGTDFQLIAEPSTNLANWRERTYPASPVLSVDGLTGAVTTGVVAATANTTARRGATGTLLVATATQAGEATTLAQTQALLTGFGRDRGSGSALPNTDLRRGDIYFHVNWDCLFEYVGSAWRQATVPSLATYALRDTYTTTYAAALHTGFRIYLAADGGDQVWNGSWWNPVHKLPTIRQFRATGTTFNTATYLAVPYDGLDAAQTHNPGNEWFAPIPDVNNRYVTLKRSGLYAMQVEACGSGGMGARIYTFTSGTTLDQPLASGGSNNFTGPMLMVTQRLAANTRIGAALSNTGSDAADGTNGFRNHLIITRLGD